LPANFAQKIINENTPRLNTIFARPWQLFTPPPHYNQRLYLITKSTTVPLTCDTMELLGNLAKNKQEAAPFNQKENILEHMINNSVSGLLYTVWTKKKMSEPSYPGSIDSLLVAASIKKAAFKNNYIICLSSIKNYGLMVLKEQKIKIKNTELKIVIKLKMIRPFHELDNANYIQKETVVFETPYQPIQ